MDRLSERTLVDCVGSEGFVDIRPLCPACGHALSLQVNSFYCPSCGKTFASSSVQHTAPMPVESVNLSAPSPVSTAQPPASEMTYCPNCATPLARQVASYYCPGCGKTYPRESAREGSGHATANERNVQEVGAVAATRAPSTPKAPQNNLEILKVLGIVAALFFVAYIAIYAARAVVASFMIVMLDHFGIAGVVITLVLLGIAYLYFRYAGRQSKK